MVHQQPARALGGLVPNLAGFIKSCREEKRGKDPLTQIEETVNEIFWGYVSPLGGGGERTG